MHKKSSIALKISLLVIALGCLASCASSQQRPTYKSSMPAHCAFQENRKPAQNKKKAQAPPSSVTPIGGNYRVRN